MLAVTFVRALRLNGKTLMPIDLDGRILTHDLSPDLRKGRVLSAAEAPALSSFGEIHVAELEPGDVHEDEAGRRLAGALAKLGPLRIEGPSQSQYRLIAERRGLLTVNAPVLARINSITGIAVFTLYHGQAVEAGEEVAGCKVTPVAVPEQALLQAEYDALEMRVIELLPFTPLATSIVVTEKLKPRARQMFGEAVRRKLGWYGAEVLGVDEVPRSQESVRDAYRRAEAAGAELVLFAGSSTIDPLDPAYSELEHAGGDLVRFGMPAHPGSMLWMGRLGKATVLGIASCAGFGRSTSLDLVLPFVFAGAPVDLAGLGHGGLIEKAAGRTFPPYPPD
jgi:hypothetical protein